MKNENVKKPIETKPFASFEARWMGWAGAISILLGVVVLVVVVGQVARLATQGVQVLTLPGKTDVSIKKSGLYLGVLMDVPLQEAMENASGLRVSITEAGSGLSLPAQRVPPGLQLRLGKQAGLALFQCEIPQKNPISFHIQMPGIPPNALMYLVHESVGQGRGDLIGGLIVFLLFCALGVYFFVRAMRARRLESAGQALFLKK